MRHPLGRTPRPLRTLAATWLAVTAVGLCALVAQAVLWADRHPWIVLLVGTATAAVVALRRRPKRGQQAMRPFFQSPQSIEAQATRSYKAPLAVPSRRSQPYREKAQGQGREPVYLGKERIGWMDADGTIRLDKVAP